MQAGGNINWVQALKNVRKEKDLKSVHILVPQFVSRVMEVYDSVLVNLKKEKKLSENQKKSVQTLLSALTVLSYTSHHELAFEALNNCQRAIEELSQNKEDALADFVESLVPICFSLQTSETMILRQCARNIYSAFSADVSANSVQSLFDVILPNPNGAFRKIDDFADDEKELEEMEVENKTSDDKKAGNEQQNVESSESTNLKVENDDKEDSGKSNDDESDEESIEIGDSELADVLMSEGVEIALARAVKMQIDKRKKDNRSGDYWVRLLDLVEVLLAEQKLHVGITAAVPILVDIIRRKNKSRHWDQLRSKCVALLTRISKLKKLGHEGIDKGSMKAMIEDTVRFVIKEQKYAGILGKIVGLLNAAYYSCSDAGIVENEKDAEQWLQQNIEEEQQTLVDYWKDECTQFLNRKRRIMTDDAFHRLSIINCPNLSWSVVLHCFSQFTEKTRVLHQGYIFQWLGEASQKSENIPEKLVQKLCEQVTKAFLFTFPKIKKNKLKKVVLKSISQFMNKLESYLNKKPELIEHFKGILKEKENDSYTHFGNFESLVEFIESVGENKKVVKSQKGKKRKLEKIQESTKKKQKTTKEEKASA